MDQRLKRILNAFALGFLSSMLLLLIEKWQDLTNAVAIGDWVNLKTLGISLASGAMLAGLRAIQSLVMAVPSPEPDENSPS